MNTRAKWGSVKQFAAEASIGDRFIGKVWNQRRAFYSAFSRVQRRIRIQQIGGRGAAGRYGFIATVIE